MSRHNRNGPAIAGATVDTETGTTGDDDATDAEKALYALSIMRDRGLISVEEFERRRAALIGSKG